MSKIGKYINLSSGEVIPVTELSDGLYINQDIDIDEIVNEIYNNIVAPRYRIFVLYPDETINYEIPLEDILTGGSFNENYQNGQRRSLSFSLYNIDGKYTPSINTFWAGTRLKLELGLERADGTIIWFQKGIFIVTKASPELSSDRAIVQINASDKFSLFEEKTGTLTSTYTIEEGSEIEEVIKTIALTDMGNGSPMDSKPIIYHSSFKNKKTEVEITKNAGDTLGSILLDLATQLSAEIFYNSMGNLTIVPIDEVTLDVTKPIMFDYNFDNGELSNINFDFDLSSIINRIIVIGSSNNGGVYRAVAVNDDAASPLCYQRIGYRTGSIINDSNISNDILAEERAQYELRSQLILKSSLNMNVLYNPFLSVNNLISINCEFYHISHEKFLIQSLSYSLDYSGEMGITISNLTNLPTLVM